MAGLFIIPDFPKPNIHYSFIISSRYSLFSFHPREAALFNQEFVPRAKKGNPKH